MKKYCAVFQDGFEVKIACAEKQGGKIKVLRFLSVPSADNQFIYSVQKSSNNLSADVDIEITEFDNRLEINTHLFEISSFERIEDLSFIPVITEPHVSYLVHKLDVNKKSSEIKNKLTSEWKENANVDIPADRIDYIEYKNHFLISAVVQENIPVLNELKALAQTSETRTLDILPLRSGDIALINYALNIYRPEQDETYLLIYIGTDSIRLIFIKEGKVVHINKYLGLSIERSGIVSFLSSKIVLEMEYAGVTELTNIIITGEINDELISSVKQSFPFANVEILNLNIFDFSSLEEELIHKTHSYILPLLAICDEVYNYSNVKKNLEFQTKRLSKISFFRKFDFFSLLLVVVLGALIFFSLRIYKERAEQLKKLREQISKIETIKSVSSTEMDKINYLSKQYDILNAYNNFLNESLNSLIRWTDQLLLLESYNPHKNKIWITSISLDEQNPSSYLLKGLAIDRSRIPDLMATFKNAELKNIYIYEIRNKKIFQFELTISVKN